MKPPRKFLMETTPKTREDRVRAVGGAKGNIRANILSNKIYGGWQRSKKSRLGGRLSITALVGQQPIGFVFFTFYLVMKKGMSVNHCFFCVNRVMVNYSEINLCACNCYDC